MPCRTTRVRRPAVRPGRACRRGRPWTRSWSFLPFVPLMQGRCTRNALRPPLCAPAADVLILPATRLVLPCHLGELRAPAGPAVDARARTRTYPAAVDSPVSTSLRRVVGASPPAVDIAVPYADENRNHVLLSEWRRQAGESLPAPPLTLPRRSEGAYRVRIRARRLLGIPVEDQYSDAVAGATGGPRGHHGDLIVTHIMLSGEWRFTPRNQTSRAGAGTLCVRRNEEPWGMEAARGTRAVAVGLPASAIRFPSKTLAVTAEQTSPAARLLLAQLRLLAEVGDELGPASAAGA